MLRPLSLACNAVLWGIDLVACGGSRASRCGGEPSDSVRRCRYPRRNATQSRQHRRPRISPLIGKVCAGRRFTRSLPCGVLWRTRSAGSTGWLAAVRGLIGLTGAQERTAARARQEVLSGEPDQLRAYFTRKCRDKRFDAVVHRGIKSGSPWTGKQWSAWSAAPTASSPSGAS